MRKLICRLFHRRITRPICGHYICLHCFLRFPVEWN